MPSSAKIAIKNPQYELKLFLHRLIIVSIVIFCLTLLLFFRLMMLQIFQEDRYLTLSNQNQLGLIPIEPHRGLIYDRNGVLIADNLPIFSLDIIPARVTSLKKTIAELKQLFSINDEEIKNFYKSKEGKKRFQPTPLKFNLTEAEIAKFYVNQWRFPGVMITSRFMRYYPQAENLVPVLGFMSRINESELQSLDSVNYSATSQIGKLGIEKHFESILHGQVGYQQVETDANGRIVRTLKKVPPVPGHHLYLTIDSQLQKAAAEALGNQPGAVVAIAPQSGEVLALYSNPSYDPNLFVTGIKPKDYQTLQNAKGRPLYNRALRGLYAPASTAKPYMALEGLSSGVVTPNFSVVDPGYFIFGHHTYKDWRKGGHGVVNAEKAITSSCDTYFFTLAVKLGIYRMVDILTQFGFGQKTGIEIDEELAGLVPTPAWKKKVHHHAWYTGDTIVNGIGQGYLLETPLQMASGVASIANQGKRMQLHLLYKMVTPDGQMIQTKPHLISRINIAADHWKIVQKGMIGVIQAPWGTGFRFGKNIPYSVAAKTGTAQVFHSNVRYKESDVPEYLRDHSTFIAYAPVEHPQIAIAVVAEHSELAASVARRVIDTFLIKEKHLRLTDKTKTQI